MKRFQKISVQVVLGLLTTLSMFILAIKPVIAQPISLDPNYSASILASGLSRPANGLIYRQATNDLLVTEYGAHKVSRIDATTGAVSFFTSVSFPDEMAIDSSGNIYVKTHTTGGPINIFDSSGGSLCSFSTPSPSDFPTGLAFDNSDNFYLAITSGPNAGTIFKYAAGTTTSPIVFASGFPSLEGIAFSPTGKLFVTDHLNGRVFEVTPGGTTLASHILWATGLSTPLNFAFDPISGDIFCSNTDTVVRISAPGVVTTFASGFTTGYGLGTYDLDFDPAGNLYVDDFSRGEIWKFSPIPPTVPKFLTLPFRDPYIKVQQGWIYTFDPDPDAHKGIDYKKGNWESFDVVAAANGRAMWSEQYYADGSGYGKFVLIWHEEKDPEGNNYFTLYAHLDSVAPGIPYKDRHNTNYLSWKLVNRGEVIGRAGNTGAPGVGVHLHFEVQRKAYAHYKTDPYDLYTTREYYPNAWLYPPETSKYTRCGPNHLWTKDPPELPTPPEWTFAIITDLHIGRGYPDYGGEGWNDAGTTGQNYYLTERLNDTVKWIEENRGRYNFKFVVVLGDIADSAEYSELEKAKSILDDLDNSGIPYVPVIGNHDVWPYTEDEEADYPESDRHFRKIFIEERLDVLKSYFKDWDSPLITETVEWGVRPWKKEWTAYLQNYVFNYNGVEFIALDCVAREPFPLGKGVGGDAVLWSSTLNWLRENLHEDQPTVIFSHHPFITDMFVAFQNDEMESITKAIIDSKAKVRANFAGHIHGYYDPPKIFNPLSFDSKRELLDSGLAAIAKAVSSPIFVNANNDYTEEGFTTPAGIQVVTTEAVMVASNEQTPKGIIRVVKVKGEEIDFNTIDGEFKAVNPYFKEIDMSEWRPPWRFVVEFEVYAFTKRFTQERPGIYTIDFGDGTPSESKESKRWDEAVQFDHDYRRGKHYDVTLTVTGWTPEGERIEEEITRRIYVPTLLSIGAFSPVDIALTDPEGRMINRQLNEIPGAEYIEVDLNEDGDLDDLVLIPDPLDGNYTVLLIGTATGAYSLNTELIALQETTFVAVDIPISANAFHQYTIDWNALSLGEEGVTVEVDSDGDGVFELTFASDSELTQSEYVAAINAINTWVTDSDFNEIDGFRAVFSPYGNTTLYKLTATNPGQFYFNILVNNIWPETLNLTIVYLIDADFGLKGAKPIHVYADLERTIDITENCTFSDNTITVYNVAPNAIIYITIHLDYALKGTTWNAEEVEAWYSEHGFSATVRSITHKIVITDPELQIPPIPLTLIFLMGVLPAILLCIGILIALLKYVILPTKRRK